MPQAVLSSHYHSRAVARQAGLGGHGRAVCVDTVRPCDAEYHATEFGEGAIVNAVQSWQPLSLYPDVLLLAQHWPVEVSVHQGQL